MIKRLHSFGLQVICVLFLFSTFSYAADIADREVLYNGITLLHAEKTGLPIVTVVVAIKAGSVAEPAEKAGLANLTADLLNEGTKKRSSKEISEAIEFVGGSLGTSGGADYITVSLSVLKKDVGLGFDLLSDIIRNPAFSADEVQRRKTSIKNSIIQQKEEPGTIASKAFAEAVYGKHPYGRPVEGTEESLDRITAEDIESFHREYYLPNRTIMTVVGDIGRSELKSLLERYFMGWQAKEAKEAAFKLPDPVGKPKVITIQKSLTQANIILGHPGIRRDNPDYYAVSVMNYILGGGGFASRLMDNIRDNKGLAYDVHSSFPASKYGGSFQAELQTKNESANTAISEVLKEIGRIRTEPVSDRELSDAKAYLTGSFPLRIDSNRKMAGFLTAVEYYGLGLDYVDNYRDYIESVTKDDILRVARKYLHPENYVLVVVGDLDKAALKY
ncbi:MAG: insulinase family protein [Nitrospirota bacterium]|nr:insulinase family protein [Nitrospirota bacterium]